MRIRLTTKVLIGIVSLFILLTLPTQVRAGTTMENNTNRPGQDYKNFWLDTPDPGLCRDACANDPDCQSYTYVKPGIQGAKARCWLKKSVPAAQSDNCCVSGVKKSNTLNKIPAVRLPLPGNRLPGALPNPMPRPALPGEPVPGALPDPMPVPGALPNPMPRPALPGEPTPAALPHPMPRSVLPGDPTPRTLQTQVKAGTTMENNTNRPGQDYKNFWLNTPDPGLCRDACANDPKCQAYTYVKPGIQGAKARCWLKKTVPAAQSDNCCVSGVKETQTTQPVQPPQVDDDVNSYCKSYADNALKQRRLRKELGASIPAGDPVWSDDWQMHYNWCLKVPKIHSQAGTQMRNDWLISSHSTKPPVPVPLNEDSDKEFVVYISDEEGRFEDYAAGFINEFQNTWKLKHYSFGKCSYLGSEHLDYVDSADLAFLVGHGNASYIKFKDIVEECSLDNMAWGSYSSPDRTGDLEYIVFMSCKVLKMDSPKDWRGRWRHDNYEEYTKGVSRRPFSGLHMALGFLSNHMGTPLTGRLTTEEFAENLKVGLPVRLAWFEAVNDYRWYWWVDPSQNLPAVFYIRPHKDEKLDEHDSPDFRCGDPEYLLDAFYGSNEGHTLHEGWKPGGLDPTSWTP